jgi:hypothetical protein
MADYRPGDRLAPPAVLAALDPAAAHPQRTISDGYFASYTGSDAITHEHLLDAEKLSATLQALPNFWRHLQVRARSGLLAALDTCAGEAAKTMLVCRDLIGHLGTDRMVLHAEEPDRRQLGELIRRAGVGGPRAGLTVNVLATTLEGLLADLAAGIVTLDPPPAFATNIHGGYYLEQADDNTIPALAQLAHAMGDGLVCYINEGPGDLQDMKAHMHRRRGLGRPCSAEMIARTLQTAGIPQAPPIRIPNRSWQVDRTLPPEVMFDRSFRFLLDNNWGNNRPLQTEDLREAGRFLQQVAQPRHTNTGTLDADDVLIVGGRWLDRHPADLEALVHLAHQTT